MALYFIKPFELYHSTRNYYNRPDVIILPFSPTLSCPPLSPQRPHPAPAKLGFLVSFLVDARGGAMKGNRGSGMRLIIPPGKPIFALFWQYWLWRIQVENSRGGGHKTQKVLT